MRCLETRSSPCDCCVGSRQTTLREELRRLRVRGVIDWLGRVAPAPLDADALCDVLVREYTDDPPTPEEMDRLVHAAQACDTGDEREYVLQTCLMCAHVAIMDAERSVALRRNATSLCSLVQHAQ